MRLTRFEKQARRRSVYYVVGFFGILVVGTVMVISILAATNQRIHSHLYHDPEMTLRLVFAQNETKWRYVPPKDHLKFASMEELVDANLISEEFLLGPVEGFRYRVKTATATSFVVTAEPEGAMPSPDPNDPGRGPRPNAPIAARPRLYYVVDESHTIRADDKGPATAQSPVVWSPRDLSAR